MVTGCAPFQWRTTPKGTDGLRYGVPFRLLSYKERLDTHPPGVTGSMSIGAGSPRLTDPGNDRPTGSGARGRSKYADARVSSDLIKSIPSNDHSWVRSHTPGAPVSQYFHIVDPCEPGFKWHPCAMPVTSASFADASTYTWYDAAVLQRRTEVESITIADIPISLAHPPFGDGNLQYLRKKPDACSRRKL